jgi:hypothetical protein
MASRFTIERKSGVASRVIAREKKYKQLLNSHQRTFSQTLQFDYFLV